MCLSGLTNFRSFPVLPPPQHTVVLSFPSVFSDFFSFFFTLPLLLINFFFNFYNSPHSFQTFHSFVRLSWFLLSFSLPAPPDPRFSLFHNSAYCLATFFRPFFPLLFVRLSHLPPSFPPFISSPPFFFSFYLIPRVFLLSFVVFATLSTL